MTQSMVESEPETPNLYNTVGRIAAALRAATERRGTSGATKSNWGPLSPGDAAALRRVKPSASESALPPAAFWKIASLYLEPHLSRHEARRAQQERRWLVLVVALAKCHGSSTTNGRLGAQLAGASISEMRVQALLRASADQLADQVLAVVHLAHSRGQGLDFGELARLILYSPSSDAGDRIRRSVARSYYSASYRKEHNS